MAYKKNGNKITRRGGAKQKSKNTKKRFYRKYKGGDTCEKINETTCICKDDKQRIINKWRKSYDTEAKSNYWFDEIDNVKVPATWKPPCN